MPERLVRYRGMRDFSITPEPRGRRSLSKKQRLLIKRHDEDADPSLDITRERPESVRRAPKKAKRSKKSELPQLVAPMLATLVAGPPAAGEWIYEVKHDGYRMLARLAGEQRRLFTRSGKDWTSRLPHLAAALAQLGLDDTWLDGEIVVPGADGRASFQRLQNAFEAGRDRDIVYFVFDAPFLGGQDLRRLPLAERKRRLRKRLKDSRTVRFSGEGRLRYAGKVGTGFDEQRLKCLTRRFTGLRRPDPPFVDPPKEKGVQWLRPALVAEVAYAERTREGILRQAAFMGLREDLPAKNVHEERAVGVSPSSENLILGVQISHPQRLVWPRLGIRKIDLARYVEEVGDWLLPHVKNRPLSLVRCPDGAEGECFYQRHLTMAASPGSLRTVKRTGSSRGAYLYAAAPDALVSAVQNGAIEFHTWGATVPDITRPDRIVMDLDPDESLPWKALVGGTLLTKALLDGLGLRSFLKSTGGKGLHVVAPIEPELEWTELKAFTQRIAQTLVKARPELFTASIAKARRPGKIFADYLRNSETASAVAAFSPRARPGAGVSVPLAWDELDVQEDLRARFTLLNVGKRLATLKRDPWADYWTSRQSITPKMKKSLGLDP